MSTTTGTTDPPQTPALRPVVVVGPSARPKPTAVEVRDLTVTYPNGVTAVERLNLTVPAGQQLAIIGASGSGKTTLLKCLSGRLSANSGRTVARGRVAVIHQDLQLVSRRSALQNVMHGAMGRVPAWRTFVRFPRAERKRAMVLLQRVGLEHRAHTRVGRLSGGEQQRVAIARALMQDPKVLLADEPVATLDVVNARQIMGLLKELGRDSGLTLVVVLHDCELAEGFCDRIIALNRGTLAWDSHSPRPEQLPACEACKVLQETATIQAAPPTDPPSLLGTAARFAGIAVLTVLAYAWAVSGLNLQPDHLQGAATGLGRFLGQLLPTSFSEITQIPWALLWGSLLETLQMSLIGTTIGVALSWPLAAIAAKNVGPRSIRGPVRFLLNTIRTVPSLIWALLFVSAIGFGPVAGVLALAAYSVGYLTKFFYEAFEAVERGPCEALSEIGASGPQVFLQAVWPTAKPAVLSSCLFMLEYNVRAASVLGIVDAGGIGYYIKQFLDWRQFPAAMACLALLLAVVVVLDAVSTRLRARLVKI